jgi:hypothetical protein
MKFLLVSLFGLSAVLLSSEVLGAATNETSPISTNTLCRDVPRPGGQDLAIISNSCSLTGETICLTQLTPAQPGSPRIFYRCSAGVWKPFACPAFQVCSASVNIFGCACRWGRGNLSYLYFYYPSHYWWSHNANKSSSHCHTIWPRYY